MSAKHGNRFIDISGQRFGRLTVIGLSGAMRGKNRKYEWLCKCDCGNEHLAVAGHLRDGNVHSCGCLNDEGRRRKRKPDELTSPSVCYSRIFVQVKKGERPPARDLDCVDCGKQACDYDHYLGYGEHWNDVQPVCRSCHHRRGFERGERPYEHHVSRPYTKGRFKRISNSQVHRVRLCAAIGLFQKDIADCVGISGASIARILEGRYFADLKTEFV